ncbi:MAG TPA: hypothetical protein VFK52_10250 [Nocardioidaceae bacterium]|nr:hypothetical protein [Nocardioidaceae bacterium]
MSEKRFFLAEVTLRWRNQDELEATRYAIEQAAARLSTDQAPIALVGSGYVEITGRWLCLIRAPHALHVQRVGHIAQVRFDTVNEVTSLGWGDGRSRDTQGREPARVSRQLRRP